MQDTERNNPKPSKSNVNGIGQGEARHRKYKRLKLDSGQVYDRSANCSFRIVA
jgi:hypothetical protein